MDYDDGGAAELAVALAEAVATRPAYRPVETDGAARAARTIRELL